MIGIKWMDLTLGLVLLMVAIYYPNWDIAKPNLNIAFLYLAVIFLIPRLNYK